MKPDYSKISEEPTAFIQSNDDFMKDTGTYYFGKLKKNNYGNSKMYQTNKRQ
jgi:hypothetical protein